MRLIDIEDFYNRDKYEVLIITKGEGRTVARMLDFLEIKAYTKADMADMLTDIQLEIEELDSRAGYDGNGMPTFSSDYIRKKKVNELIQQKINEIQY